MTTERVGVVIVDHGSRREESNWMLKEAVSQFAEHSAIDIIEPAHMELAQPDIATAFSRCVSRGANQIVVFPYFLSPGRHSTTDIPDLVAQAADSFPGVTWRVAKPFGLHPAMQSVISDRITECLDCSFEGNSTRGD